MHKLQSSCRQKPSRELQQTRVHIYLAGKIRQATMEDVIIYSVGALVVRGLRRAVFGPPREEKLAEEVGTRTCFSACVNQVPFVDTLDMQPSRVHRGVRNSRRWKPCTRVFLTHNLRLVLWIGKLLMPHHAVDSTEKLCLQVKQLQGLVAQQDSVIAQQSERLQQLEQALQLPAADAPQRPLALRLPGPSHATGTLTGTNGMVLPCLMIRCTCMSSPIHDRKMS